MLLSENLLPLICVVLRGPAGRRVLDARRGRGRLGGFSRARRGGRHHDVSTAAPVRVRWSYVPLRPELAPAARKGSSPTRLLAIKSDPAQTVTL